MKIAIANQKGGVAKTTSTINLGSALAGQCRVLVVDFDPQAACAISLGIDPDELPATTYDVLMGKQPAQDAVLSTTFGFDLVPSNIDLAEAEIALVGIPLREYAARRQFGELFERYDVVLIDTPPTLGLLTINAFAAANAVLIPVSTQLLSLRGLQTLLETIDKLRHYGVNEQLQVAGILPTKYDARTVHAREVLAYLTEYANQRHIPIFEPIRATVRFDEAPNEQAPFVVLHPEHEAAQAYRQLAERILHAQEELGHYPIPAEK